MQPAVRGAIAFLPCLLLHCQAHGDGCPLSVHRLQCIFKGCHLRCVVKGYVPSKGDGGLVVECSRQAGMCGLCSCTVFWSCTASSVVNLQQQLSQQSIPRCCFGGTVEVFAACASWLSMLHMLSRSCPQLRYMLKHTLALYAVCHLSDPLLRAPPSIVPCIARAATAHK